MPATRRTPGSVSADSPSIHRVGCDRFLPAAASPPAYNPRMFRTLQQLATTAAMERFVLLANHVIASEEAAVRRLAPHAGRSIRVELTGWPSLLPALPSLVFGITRAGLLEWAAAEAPAAADLELRVDASRPAHLLMEAASGRRPAVEVSGNAALAADVSWLMDNLRWDIQDDLARVIGEGPARELARVGAMVANGLRESVAMLARVPDRWRRRDGHHPAGADQPPAR